jgi:hypothetical protein
VLVIYDSVADYDYFQSMDDTERCHQILAGIGLPEGHIIMECYDTTLDIEEQLREHRAWHP